MPSDDSADVLIVAAEASSSLYALRLLELWTARGIPVSAFGVGSREMEAAGFEILGRAEEMAVVGFQEVISHYGDLKRVFLSLVNAAKTRRPRFALLLDYPGFNLRLAKRLKALGIPVIYYVSPQVWAWHTSRVKIIRANVDRMLVILPFEEAFYKQHGVAADFVGHPLLDELSGRLFDEDARRERRAALGFTDADVVLGLMPGSRRSELRHHLAVQLEAAATLVSSRPNVKLALLLAPTLVREDVDAALAASGLKVTLVQDEPFEMISVCDVVLCASGTATLMVGMMQKPMVIMYRMNALTVFIARWIIKRPKHFGLINLVLDERVVPELFQNEANAGALAAALAPMLDSLETREGLSARLARIAHVLGKEGATERVAAILQPYLSDR